MFSLSSSPTHIPLTHSLAHSPTHSLPAHTPHAHTRASQAREEYFKRIEATLETLKARAVSLPTELTAAITAAIADARANLENAHLFDRVKAAYDAVLKYPAVVAVVEKTAPVAAKAVDMATPYYISAKDMASPYVTKVGEVAGPYVTAIKDKVWAAPSAATETAQ